MRHNIALETKIRIINREIYHQCLNCGRSLLREIMDKKIHIHLCKKCRMKILEIKTEEVLKRR